MAVTKEQLPEFIRKTLGSEYLDKKGGILYSSHETICAGDVYLIGLNPGGGGKDDKAPELIKCLDSSYSKEYGVANIYRTNNAYWDEKWGKEDTYSLLQERVQWLLEGLVGKEKAKKVFATNLIFVQSPNDKGVSVADANTCWPVHEAFLSIVRPRLILAFGNAEGLSPYSYMRGKYSGKDKECREAFEHGTRELKGFHTEINGQDVFVAGLPHLSWRPHYSSKIDDNQPVINWIKSHWLKKNQQA